MTTLRLVRGVCGCFRRFFEDDEFGEDVVQGNHNTVGQNLPEKSVHMHHIDCPDHDSKVKQLRDQTEPGKREKLPEVLLEGLVAAVKDIKLVGYKGNQNGDNPGNQGARHVGDMEQIEADIVGHDIGNRRKHTPERVIDQLAVLHKKCFDCFQCKSPFNPLFRQYSIVANHFGNILGSFRKVSVFARAFDFSNPADRR